MACADMKIVFSGFRDDNLKSQIENAKGKAYVSMVKNATHLLVKKDAKPSKKIEEAKEREMNVIFLEDFLKEYDFTLADKPEVDPNIEILTKKLDSIKLLCKNFKKEDCVKAIDELKEFVETI